MTEESAKQSAGRPPRSNRRRQKFVRKDLQLRIIFGSLFVALVVLVMNFQLPIMGMWIMRATSSVWLDAHYNVMIKLLVASFGTSLLLTVPLAVWMGVVFSFQFCGPIYKIKKFFVELNSGRWDRICRLRKGDDLQDVKDVINQYVGLTRDRMRSQHQTLEKVRGFLQTCERSDDVDSLLTLINEEDAEYRHRLGTSEANDGPDAASEDEATAREESTVAATS